MSGICSKCNENCIFKESKNDLFGFPCDTCKRVLCRTCAEFSATEVRTLVQVKRVLPYFCEDCLVIVKQMPLLKTKITELQSDVEALKEQDTTRNQSYADVLKTQLTELQRDVKVLKEQDKTRNQSYADVLKMTNDTIELKGGLDKLEEKVEKINQTESKSNTELSIIEELCEREKRATNILLFGVPESENQNTETRNQEEQNKVTRLLEKINQNATTEIKLFRLGKPEAGKIRPIKIIFPEKQIAKEILKHKKKLDNNGIYIKGDLTIMQRKFLKDVVAELKSRTDNGEQNLKIIYHNSIPKIVKTKEYNVTKN